MSLELVRSYLHESVQAYNACATALGIPGAATDLFALLRAARRGSTNRRGELTTPEGVCYEYHIHGSGYSFTARANGRRTNFDACVVGNNQCVRFTIWHLQQYAASIGQELTREAAQEALQGSEAVRSQVIHITEGEFEYYVSPVMSAEK